MAEPWLEGFLLSTVFLNTESLHHRLRRRSPSLAKGRLGALRFRPPQGKAPLLKGALGVLPLPRTRKASRICGISVIKQAFPLPFRRKMWYTAFYPK